MQDKIGAVLVVGAGISGIQSALDLADSGYKVYLLDRNPSIGGTMVQLDKTFPTNDCSMCILAPKLVGAGRHHNIELIPNSDIVSIEGDVGNFKVTIKKRARHIFEDKCTGCAECVEACPVEVPNEYNEHLNSRKAVHMMFPQAVPRKVSISKRGIPPCKSACPAHVNGQGFIALISMGKYLEALNLIRERCALPSVIGRICHHPCEKSCNRIEVDEPINICGLKRFVADHVRENMEEEIELPEEKKEKVAIVGSGPSGLTVAYHLARLGYPVTIFERNSHAGGMLSVGIPDYRLPPDILNADIEHIKRCGVKIKTDTPIGPPGPTIKELLNEFQAVYLGVGLPDSRGLNIEGEDLKNVIPGMNFLKDCKLGKKVTMGKKVLVIGGGNVAVDVARSALRKGSREVHLVMLESEDIIPAHPWEVDEAKEEGIVFHCSQGPKRFVGKDGKVAGVETLFCSSVFDENGRFNPVLDPGTEEIISGDMIIVSIGQAGDLKFLDKDIKVGRGIEVDKNNFQTSMQGVFAGGEIIKGPGSAMDSMAIGIKVAIVMEKYLKGEDISHISETIPDYQEEDIVKIENIQDLERFPLELRNYNTLISPDERKKNFNEFTKGMDERTARIEAARCLNCGICSECFECVRVCLAEALNHEQVDEIISIDVGSVILSPGFDEFDPRLKAEYGYKTVKNVMSSIEFERILSATGPFEGHVKRMSDQKQPETVAFVQCVGSRDSSCGNEYCSSVCCMYSIKEAIIAQEHTPGLKTEIFFMDIRAFGKEFDEYYIRAEKEYGIKFTRSRVANIVQGEDDNVIVSYVEDGEVKTQEFEMAVLAVGFESTKSARELSKQFGIELNKYNFAKTKTFSPLETTRHGVYVSGAFNGPKDIPDTVAQASAAASKASGAIFEARGTLVTEKEYPPERDVSGEEPRIGVFVCHCGINIGGTVDVPSVVEYAQSLPYVIYAERNLYTCSQDTQEKITETIKEHNLNRVIVASCSPRTHEPLFQCTCREAGLNPYLFEMANIRDQCSWIHMHEPILATAKAKDLVRMAVAKSRYLEPLVTKELPVTQRALVIGGGISGMTAALDLANQGFQTYLVEREKEFGGRLRNTHYILDDIDSDPEGLKGPQEYLHDIVKEIDEHGKIQVFLNSEVSEIEGYVGNFHSKIKINTMKGIEKESEPMALDHGIVVVATGAGDYKPTEYLYGNNPDVITQKELEEKLAHGDFSADSVVMIQCVGSRNEERPYCSRVCCGEAIKNAIKIKDKKPDTDVYILYKDIRTYGFREEYYQKAANMGVLFIRFDDDNRPEVNETGKGFQVMIFDQILGEHILLKPDQLVLSNGMLPSPGTEDLAKMLKLPVNKDGFFLEAHMKLRPVDFALDGVYLCGLAHSPKYIEECISQASGAAARASTVISKMYLEAEGIIANVDGSICAGCGVCEGICEYKAIEIIEDVKIPDRRIASVNEGVCKGCGACAGTCPSGAINQKGFTNNQVYNMIEAFLEAV